ncbi:SusC/RagA family TonB-linked outer membrane protein [Flavitalea sp. BT771]|uniref:SusC/RagA family TonB-linked outer membrane protein n=1 Tax=Flavitalea sp. BT771 TaxID=3063329 RepID=UPI0026E2C1A8|nr:SusC/RagA family TonB-linked outer membrane protein [Flavitalea sp. BT771]MDO6435442.1 SusC/RagA family TonB-linked outer membrane protein [Flavitalea sp. BT771]MDV6224198.1 SusC/RagA family TonB-linked outer membrane protein [Flavitalea sp. BT771]
MKILTCFLSILLFLQASAATADPVTITGKVSDSRNNPLAGVSIMLKGSSIGATTDVNGHYTVKSPQSSGTLIFTNLGYASQEVSFTEGKTAIDVTMTEIAKGLNEVIVVGYGTQRQGEITSAVASVKSENFVKGAAGDAAQLIRGKVAGLSVVTTDGNPTGTAQVNLRGIATLNASTTPLVIIDGVPGTLTSVAPEDIESIDVLKDGSAAAIYGTRGTNGVILITTRKSKGSAAPKMDLNTYFTTQRITKRLDFLSASEYRQYVQQGKPGATDYGGSTDWLKEVMQKPLSQVYNLDLRGSSENTNYIVNINYRNLNGIMQRSNNKIIYPRLEVNHSMFNGMLKLNANINGYEQNYFGFDGGGFRGDVYRNAIYLNPTQPVRNPDGTFTEHTDKTDYANPVSLLYTSDGMQQNTDLRTSGTAVLTPIRDLDIRLLVSRDLLNNLAGYSETRQNYSTLHDGKNGYAARGAQRSVEDLLEATVNYKRSIGDHTVTGLAGYSWRQNDVQSFYAQNYDFPTDDYSYNSLQSGRALSRGQGVENSYRSQNKLVGYFFRLNYSFQDKYLLATSIRREGSSKFGSNHKYGNFPAASIGWNAKQESFLIDIKTISSLKFRAGYGITGTEPSTPYLSLDRINFNTYTLINGQWIQVINPSSNANPDLRWEKKKELNIGVDIGFMNNRLTATVDYYKRTTSDLLFNYPVSTPPYLYNNITANAASMQNKGVEVQLNFAVIQGKDLTWNTQVNYSTNSNKILSLSDKHFQLASGYFDAGFLAEPIQTPTSRVQIGLPVGNFYGFKSVDIDDQGHWIILGKDGKPKPIVQAQADDKMIIGNGLPKHYLSWNNSLSYKNFDLNITMRGAFDFQILNTPRIWYDAPVMMTRGNLLKTAYDKVYGKRPLADDQSVSYVSYYIENGSYWKIDNVTLGYNLRLQTKYIKTVRVYASASNLKTFTGYKGIDPEVSILGLAPGVDNRNRYPAITSYTLGGFFTF